MNTCIPIESHAPLLNRMLQRLQRLNALDDIGNYYIYKMKT